MTGGQPPDEASAEARAGDPVPLSEAVVTSAVVWELVMPAPDGLALAGADGGLVFVNRRMEEIFGYDRAELLGSPVEKLIPAELRAAHRGHRDDYARAPRTRPMGAGLRLLGLRKDGATFPVEISLSPLATVEGPLTVAVVRDVTVTRGMEDLAKAAAAAASREGVAYELHDMVASGLFRVRAEPAGSRGPARERGHAARFGRGQPAGRHDPSGPHHDRRPNARQFPAVTREQAGFAQHERPGMVSRS